MHNDRFTWGIVHVDLDGIKEAPAGEERPAAIDAARETITSLRQQYQVRVCFSRAKKGNISKSILSDWLDEHQIRCDGIDSKKPWHRYENLGEA